jgi:hypothetical protein
MRDGEFIKVSSYDCESFEDDYEKGESLRSDAYWTGNDRPSAGMKFKSVKEALEQILKEQYFEGDDVVWANIFKEYGEDRGRFVCDVLVNDDNVKATEDEIEEWKKGNCRLWNCRINAYICVASERELNDAEIAESGI